MIEMNTLRKLMMEQVSEAHLEMMLQMIDRLHDAAAINELDTATPMDVRSVIGWLDDIIFTAEETVRELQATMHRSYTEQPERYEN